MTRSLSQCRRLLKWPRGSPVEEPAATIPSKSWDHAVAVEAAFRSYVGEAHVKRTSASTAMPDPHRSTDPTDDEYGAKRPQIKAARGGPLWPSRSRW